LYLAYDVYENKSIIFISDWRGTVERVQHYYQCLPPL